MGQSILSHREALFSTKRPLCLDGEREAGQNSGTRMWVFRGNASERGDGGRGPGKSFLFFLTAQTDPEISLSGARVQWPEERSTSAGSGVPLTSLENPREVIILTPGRTHNRSRSPR